MKAICLVLVCFVGVFATYAPKRPQLPVKQKPGTCPVSDIITTCDCRPENIKCRGDQDCPGVQKCCSFGCGCRTRCVNPAGLSSRASKFCKYYGKVYKIGSSFQSKDGCNKCRCCRGGRVRCTKRGCVKVCRYHGKTYKIGQRFRAKGGCNECRCGRNGRVNCTKGGCVKVCRYNRKVYKVGQTFPASDDCNKCRCSSGGRVSCSRRKCVKYPAKGRYVCAQPKVVGPCEARIPRWYYSKKAKCCVKFYYGGCKGNGNNFKTRAACHRRCKNRSYI